MWNQCLTGDRRISREVLGASRVGRSATALAAMMLCAASPLPASYSKCAPDIAVTFELRDRQHFDQFRPFERAAIEEEARALLIAALNRRFPHLNFTGAAQEHKLECVFNTGASVDAPRQEQPTLDRVSWHFRLGGPNVQAGPTASWEYREVGQWWDPIPSQADLLADFAIFLGSLEEPAPEVTAAAESRFSTLFGGVLARMPLLAGRQVSHIKNTPLVVIRAPRSDFVCSLPTHTEFALQLELGPLAAKHQFAAQLVPETRLAELGADIGADLQKALITEVRRPIDPTTEAHVGQLAAGAEHRALPEIFLCKPPAMDRNCLRTSPEEFDPDFGND